MGRVNGKLTTQDATFVNEFFRDFNATKAFARTGYSGRNANALGPKLLTKPAVAHEIARRLEQRRKQYERSAARVVEELHRIAHLDPRMLYRADGSVRPPQEWPDELASAVAAIEVNEDWVGEGDERTLISRTYKVRFWDKVKAAEILAYHYGLVKSGPQADGPPPAPPPDVRPPSLTIVFIDAPAPKVGEAGHKQIAAR